MKKLGPFVTWILMLVFYAIGYLIIAFILFDISWYTRLAELGCAGPLDRTVALITFLAITLIAFGVTKIIKYENKW